MLCVTAALISLSLAMIACAKDTNLRTVQRAFQEASVAKDANITFDPSVILQVQFPQADGTLLDLTAGGHVPRNATANMPLFNLFSPAFKFPVRESTEPESTEPSSSARGPGTFLVSMVDLDAPTPQQPNMSEIRHFLGPDFTLSPPKSDGLAPLTNSTPAISSFRQPTPPVGSDAHRYVFLIFSQPPGFDNQTLVTPQTPITNFSISKFAAATGLGNPLGGTFMLVAPDASE